MENKIGEAMYDMSKEKPKVWNGEEWETFDTFEQAMERSIRLIKEEQNEQR